VYLVITIFTSPVTMYLIANGNIIWYVRIQNAINEFWQARGGTTSPGLAQLPVESPPRVTDRRSMSLADGSVQLPLVSFMPRIWRPRPPICAVMGGSFRGLCRGG